MILDYRFFLIPLMFALLRMWTCMVFIFQVYTQVKSIPLPIKIMMGYLSVSTSSFCHVHYFVYTVFSNAQSSLSSVFVSVEYWRLSTGLC